ncbi:MAG: hypothetical protein MJA84_11130 [Firmicutes bacterium]|nr:hypothetical protein [Bacillota bacterium]
MTFGRPGAVLQPHPADAGPPDQAVKATPKANLDVGVINMANKNVKHQCLKYLPELEAKIEKDPNIVSLYLFNSSQNPATRLI